MDAINYQLTGNRERGTIQSYHQKPSPLFLNKGAKKADISGIKKGREREILKFGNGSEYDSRFTIGFEIEKNEFHRNVVREYELFCGFERDSSCGYEAVTHILPLLPPSTWRTKVFDMMYKAEKIIDDNFSPSDKRCGGHITIGVEELNGDELREKIRKNCGIIYALFRKRLKNSYCRHNLRMQGQWEDVEHFNGWQSKYQLAYVKGPVLEFRVPSRVQSVKQLMRRYELFYELVNFSINKPNGTHKAFLKQIAPIILSMYNGNTEEAANVLKLAEHFKNFILNGTIHESIREFI